MSSYWRTSKRLQWRSSFYSKVVRPLSYYDLWEYVLKHPPSSKSTDGWVSNFAINECLLGMEITSFRKNKTLVIGRTSFTSKVLFIRITSFNIRRERESSLASIFMVPLNCSSSILLLIGIYHFDMCNVTSFHLLGQFGPAGKAYVGPTTRMSLCRQA